MYGIILQCVLGAALGLWLHFLKKAKEQERGGGVKISVYQYMVSDPKETMISILLAAILIVGLPELSVIAKQLAQQIFGLALPDLERSFFLSAILGGFGNSLADIVGTYFGGERLKKFAARL